jgi:hypothetical protein
VRLFRTFNVDAPAFRAEARRRDAVAVGSEERTT